MPLTLSGVVFVDEVLPQEKENSSSFQAIVILEGSSGSSYDAQLKLWVDSEKGIYTPCQGAIYQLDAKVSHDEHGQLLLEAMRFFPASAEFTRAYPPHFFGTAAFDGSHSECTAMLTSTAYASGESSKVKLHCTYVSKQYAKFMSKVKRQQEVFVCGVLDDIDEANMVYLASSHFSFLGKSMAAMEREDVLVQDVTSAEKEERRAIFSPRKRKGQTADTTVIEVKTEKIAENAGEEDGRIISDGDHTTSGKSQWSASRLKGKKARKDMSTRIPFE